MRKYLDIFAWLYFPAFAVYLFSKVSGVWSYGALISIGGLIFLTSLAIHRLVLRWILDSIVKLDANKAAERQLLFLKGLMLVSLAGIVTVLIMFPSLNEESFARYGSKKAFVSAWENFSAVYFLLSIILIASFHSFSSWKAPCNLE